MYEIKGLRFQISERTENSIMFTEPEVYKELRKHEIQDDIPTLSYDEVIHIFKPEHPAYGRTIEELKLPDKETCNPSICKWCKYSSNGMRNAGRSITMCDGCRYNEEFEHIY